MKNEIGSEFTNIPLSDKTNNFFSNSTQWFLSGRSALYAILEDLSLKGRKSVAMPSWCCDSMIKPFIDAGMDVRFYPVYCQQGRIVQNIGFNCEILFLMDYFGYTAEATDLRKYNGIVIRDVTHSLFSKDYNDADYYFGSLRKWCGFWTGGFAWAKDGQQLKIANENNTEYVKLRKEAMELKDCYINCKLDNNGNKVRDKKFLSIFDEAEKLLENAIAVSADERDIVLARYLDVGFIKTRRRKNAKILMRAFGEELIFPILNKDDCPLFVPILVPHGKRNELRHYLIQHDIFCPVHWLVSKYHVLDERTKAIYDQELSLVCDQRYTKEDMNRIVETIQQFWKNN